MPFSFPGVMKVICMICHFESAHIFSLPRREKFITLKRAWFVFVLNRIAMLFSVQVSLLLPHLQHYHSVQRKPPFLGLPFRQAQLWCSSVKVILTLPPKISSYVTSVIWISSKNFPRDFTCLLGKWRTESTSPVEKSTCPGLSDKMFFALCTRESLTSKP